VAAAAGGAYVAVRHNAASDPVTVAASSAAPNQEADAVGARGPLSSGATNPAGDALKPVAETEATVSAPSDPPKSEATPPAAPARSVDDAAGTVKPHDERNPRTLTRPANVKRTAQQPASVPPATAREQNTKASDTSSSEPRETRAPAAEPHAPVSAPTNVQPRADIEPLPVEAAPPPPQVEELVVPASSVIGLRVETPLSTERARVEDRVDARVTRDVMVDGRVAVPSGARTIGSVILVERGGKLKERARLGVRFHTLVLADGTELPINTEAIYREGDSPSGESARKIGGAAVGGAILGALIGGKKGAVVGGATGAAGGTAVVMAGDRNAATLPSGTIVTIRLAAPVGVEVEKR
jgi:hypothetical protein